MQDLLVRLGLKDPNKIPGKAWRSDGYRLEELGPVRWENGMLPRVFRVLRLILRQRGMEK
jgi:hypothetical protein